MKLNWQDAVNFCRNLNFAGHTNWRLPSRNELESILDLTECNPPLPKEHPFLNVQDYNYWSGSAYSTDGAWYVNMYNGNVGSYYKYFDHYVCPVRSGQFDSSGSLIISGLSEGQARFTDNSDGTITDNRTGLVWIKDLNSINSIEVLPSNVGEDL